MATDRVRKIGLFIFLIIDILLLIVWIIGKCIHKFNRKILADLCLCAFFCFLAFFSSHNFFDNTLAVLENRTEEATIIAEIRECTYSASYSTVYTAKVESIDGKTANFSVELTYPSACDLRERDRIQTTVVFSPFSEDVYGFDERNSNIANGILVAAEFSEYEQLPKAAASLSTLFSDLRTWIEKRIDSGNMQAAAPLIKALLIGNTDELGSTAKQDFRRLGISHILSISGTHFTTLLGMVTLLLSFFGLNKRTIYVILIPLALFYMGLTGFSAAVCRAGIMSVLSYWAFLCGRVRDSYTALFIAVTVILLIKPYTVLSIGLWLSFSATFAILILMELFSVGKLSVAQSTSLGKLLFTVVSHIAVTIFVSFITLPITAASFGEISIASPIANLLLVPLFALFLYIAPFATAFSNFQPLTDLADEIGGGILSLTQTICERDGLLISVRQDFVIWIAVLGCIATVVLLALPLRRKGFVLLPSAASILAISVGLVLFTNAHAAETTVTYFTAGASDGIVLTDNNQALCIDISNGGSAAAYKAEYIAEQNYCPELAGYMFTHYHERHINQFLKLTNRTNVHAVYLPLSDDPDDTSKINAICEIAESKNIEIVWFCYDEPFLFANSSITLFAPQDIKRSTHDVICLKIEAKEQEILYLGSSYYETAFSRDADIADAEYIIFGQHAPIAKKPFAVWSGAFRIYGSAYLAELSTHRRADAVLGEDDQYEILLK
ncbi:MAG: ComEC/Rec2 family competence protein [Clostridia bacterium]|nr:ComEC/Rec2 family competence protein [Clostridia bacterium]